MEEAGKWLGRKRRDDEAEESAGAGADKGPELFDGSLGMLSCVRARGRGRAVGGSSYTWNMEFC